MAIQYHRRRSGVFFNSGGQNYPSFLFVCLFVCLFVFNIHLKGVVLELIAPICKREKNNIHSHSFFPPEASLHALYGDVDRLSTKAFLPWSDLVCPLLIQASYSSLPVLPLRQSGDASGVDLMVSKTDLFPYHQDLCLICPFPPMPPKVE